MKSKKCLVKSLALGLAIVTAVTSMGIQGGLFAPQTAYAAEGDSSENSNDENMVLSTASKSVIKGTVKLEGEAVVGSTLTASVEDGEEGAVYQYQFNRRPKKEASITGATIVQKKSECNTYTITKDDVDYQIGVKVISEGYKSKDTVWTTDLVRKKYCTVTLGESIFGEVEGSGASRVLKLNIPENLPDGTKLEYTLTGKLNDKSTWTEIDPANAFIPVGNKSYKANNICVRVKETDDTYAGGSHEQTPGLVEYAQAIRGTLEGSVAITGNIKCGETITATVTGAQDGAGLKYQFFRVKDGQSTALENASTEASYTLTPDDIGSTIKVVATDDSYDGALTAETTVVPKLKHNPLSLIVTVEAGSEGKKTVTITPVDGAEYSFDGGTTYSEKNTKEFVLAESKEPITVAIRYPEDDKYEPTALLTQTIDLAKAMSTAPGEVSLAAVVNKDKTAYDIKVTASNVSEGETLEYSTDGKTYTASDQIITGLAANTTVTLYVRKAETATANASSGTVSTITTPDASAAPTIIGDEKFKDKTSVTIVGSGEIYYTTDGKEPTTGSTRYSGAIEVSTTTTIKAIAIEDGRIMSAVTGKTFTREAVDNGNQGGTSSGGSSGSGSATTPSKDDTKADDTKKDDSKQDETTKADPSKTEISAEKIAEAAEAAGTKDAEVTVKTVDANGQTVREVTAKATDLVAGKKVKVIKIDPKTGEKTLVNETSYRVAADGSLVLDDLGEGHYKVVSLAEANALSKEILQTIKPQKTKMSLTIGKKIRFRFDDALNMDNVAKITYKTGNKSIATISKDGVITAKKAGKVTIKAVVTLKNGKKKTIKMTITVKRKK